MDIPGYKIIDSIESSDIGEVYLATQLRSGKPVVIKYLQKSLLDHTALNHSLTRFLKEGETAEQISHSNIVKVHKVGHNAEALYTIVDYVSGDSLEKRAADMCLLDKIYVVKQLAGALDYLARHKLGHYNIKPANIILSSDSSLSLLTDFGFTRGMYPESEFLAQGKLQQTADYASPELLRREEVDARSDLYSLGAVFCFLLTGKAPFKYGFEAVGSEQMEVSFVELPGELSIFQEFVDYALAKVPDERFQSGLEMIDELNKINDEKVIAIEGHQVDFGETKKKAPKQSPNPGGNVISLSHAVKKKQMSFEHLLAPKQEKTAEPPEEPENNEWDDVPPTQFSNSYDFIDSFEIYTTKEEKSLSEDKQITEVAAKIVKPQETQKRKGSEKEEEGSSENSKTAKPEDKKASSIKEASPQREASPKKEPSPKKEDSSKEEPSSPKESARQSIGEQNKHARKPVRNGRPSLVHSNVGKAKSAQSKQEPKKQQPKADRTSDKLSGAENREPPKTSVKKQANPEQKTKQQKVTASPEKNKRPARQEKQQEKPTTQSGAVEIPQELYQSLNDEPWPPYEPAPGQTRNYARRTALLFLLFLASVAFYLTYRPADSEQGLKGISVPSSGQLEQQYERLMDRAVNNLTLIQLRLREGIERIVNDNPENNTAEDVSGSSATDESKSPETGASSLTEQAGPVLQDKPALTKEMRIDQLRKAQKQERIDWLLGQAQKLKNEGKLLYPADNNAVLVYREILTISPGNTDAMFGLESVREEAIAQINLLLEMERLDAADAMLTRINIFFKPAPPIGDLAARIRALRQSRLSRH